MNGMNEHTDTTPTVSHALKYGGTAIYVDDVPEKGSVLDNGYFPPDFLRRR